MAKIDLDCNFRDCPHNVECKCSIPGGVFIDTSGRCLYASVVLDSRKTSVGGGAVDNSTKLLARLHQMVLQSPLVAGYAMSDLIKEVREQLRASGE